MQIGYTFDEKILDAISPVELLSQTKEMGVSSIEISPDEKILSRKKYIHISKLCSDLDIEIHYHVPYFADHFLYEIMNFKEYKKDIKTKYETLMSIISDIQNITCKPSILTIHGANYEDNKEQEKAFNNTLTFLDWLLNFLEKRNLSLKLALETLNKSEQVIGNSREDISYILNEFKGSKLGICWDICHDSYNYYPGKISLEDNFYDNIIYSHIHGIDLSEAKSHISIKNSDINFDDEVNFLLDKNYTGILNLELLKSFCGNSYLDDLFGDIELLSNNIKSKK
ncbi:TIM barrel protein [Wukongibacter baidiensis]|uniref:TIM barrel protein n=1 Tax=Wukongibacter baidiensis TaxID=1723361 RepID=UPI003D7FDEAC